MSGTTLEEFKARLPVAEVVGRYVRLTRRGREHTGLCPFHKEKTPSFHVAGDKGFYHCFGCGAHGNAIDFVMQVEGLEFPEALRRVAELIGIEAPEPKGGGAPKPPPGLAEANAAAAGFYHQCLWGEGGAAARAHLRERGIGRRAAVRFQLGYAPDGGTALLRELKRRGFTERQAIEAGLAAERQSGGGFDRFRHRLMFPIQDLNGRVVGFGGRTLGDDKAKYLNTGETPLFHKGRLLYGLKQAARAAREAKRVVLVEGYTDVIALAQGGIEEAVAPLGTAVTEEQLKLLWRYSDEPIVCLDGDRAGAAAAMRLIERALPAMEGGRSLRFVALPEGQDPDSFVRESGGPAFNGLLEGALPLSQALWDGLHGAVQPLDTPEKFAGLRKRLLDTAALAGDPGLRQAMRDRFFALLDEHRLRPPRRGASGSAGGAAPGRGPNPGRGWKPGWKGQGWGQPETLVGGSRMKTTLQGWSRTPGRDLVAEVLRQPELLDEIDEAFGEIEFEEDGLAALRQEILAWHAARQVEGAGLDAASLLAHLHKYGFGEAAEDVARAAPHDDGSRTQAVELSRVLDALRLRTARRRECHFADDSPDREAVIQAFDSLKPLLGAPDRGDDSA